ARIIDSPRERLIAIITNNFVPCNGRFPTLIILASLFLGTGTLGQFAASAAVVGLVLFGIAVTLLVSYILSKTVLKGVPSSFTLELPPYRKPQLKSILVRSFLDRTFFVLKRAILVAVPAGAVIWILANTFYGGQNLIAILSGYIDPAAGLMGMDGVILMAFILGLPANEIVVPIIIMSYISSGAMLEFNSAQSLGQLLLDNGWTWATALCVMLFSLLHFPCGTTLWTIKAETKSLIWTVFTALLTTGVACLVCLTVYQLISLGNFI
ncbi:MAG TPA: ferrous iron transporter B, partial [Clostridia bacterium]|nr:ferrous iron transporter B [Clostridia bacterium]